MVIEALRDLEPLLVAVNPSPAALRVADTSGLRLVSLRRTIDPSLLELNANGALNGHIPITAVISLMAVAAGYVHGYSTTVMALEGSADEATQARRFGGGQPSVEQVERVRARARHGARRGCSRDRLRIRAP